ncbi:hypothetical protein B566_EDAN002242 [Ephemera danica]|nr:hypothetical protein B566_EDAN002242 [Ephemera danica]
MVRRELQNKRGACVVKVSEAGFNFDSLNIKIVNNDIVDLTVIVSGYNDTCTKHEDCDAENNMKCDILGVCRCLNDFKWIDNKCRPYCCCCLKDEGAPPISIGFRNLSELNDAGMDHPVHLSVNLPVSVDVSVPPMQLTVNISAPTVVDEDQPPNYDDLPPPFPQSPPPDYGTINIDFPRETQIS